MAMDWGKRRARFRAVISGPHCVYPGSVFDPVSARIAEDLGFEVGMFAGSVASLTVLGAPDLIVLTLTEFAEQAYRIGRASALPLLVDADHGYGNALNVRRTVEELESAGVAALSIEDTVLPRAFGQSEPIRLISIDEGVGKMRAALDARQDPALVIAGRTSVVSSADFGDTVVRAKAYARAGVDAFFVVGAATRAQVEQIRDAVDIPIILGGASGDVMNLDYLSRVGVRICLQGHQPFMASMQAVYETLKALRDQVPPAQLKGIAAPELVNRLTRQASYQDWMEKFLRPPP
jgi:carboxyvinyl-carboxyphosphonate phosphorylmutase